MIYPFVYNYRMSFLAQQEILNPERSQPDIFWRMSVETYHQLIETGAFHPEEKVELIHGLLIKKMPKKPAHAKATQKLMILLGMLIGLDQGWFLSIQDPITLTDSEPEPDIAVVRGSPDEIKGHPTGKDIDLIIEISDSSLDYDSTVKKRLYGLNNIPEYWIVNLTKQQIERYTDPFATEDEAGYKHQALYLKEDTCPLWLNREEKGTIPVEKIF